MPFDTNAFADMVVLTVKSSLAPILERLAVAEAKIAALPVAEKSIADLRDRIVVCEAKALAVVTPSHEDAVDLTPVLERLSATEARLSTFGDLRDRVVVAETKAAAPVSIAPDPVDLAPLTDRIARLELKAAEMTPAVSAVSEVQKDLTLVRERLAVVETRPPIPGPQGEPGPAGKDGLNGKDGLPGLSFEGVWQEGQSYERGHVVTWAGASWHCNNATTTKPGEGSKDWTLMVKRGRDGRDGQDAKPTPIVSVGRTS